MVVIRIQEHSALDQQTSVIVSFDHEIQYTTSVRDPFADDKRGEADLEWYFEEYLRFPFTQGVRARKAAESIQAYGESLFTQVFAHPDALATYKQVRQQGLSTLQIEVAGSSVFHRLHWEALYDPDLQVPLSLHASLIRKNVRPQTFPASMNPSTTLRVLVVVARPGGGRDVGYRTISRPLVDELERTKLPIEVTLLRPGTFQALSRHLEQVTREHGVGYYHLIHFDVHGALLKHKELEQAAQTNRLLYAGRYGRDDLVAYAGEKAFVFLEGEREGRADPVEASELAQLLIRYQVPVVLLNACQSGKVTVESEGAVEGSSIEASPQSVSAETEMTLGSRLIEAGVQTVLAMGYSVTVSAAELLMKTLYQELFAQKTLPDALCLARQELANNKERRVFFNQSIKLEDWILPVLYQNKPVQIALQPFTPEESIHFYQKKANSYHASQQPNYGFVGRDLDILQVEKRLLTRRNVLLLRGMGGAGKTTLLHHLATWWQRTGLVQEAFYFGYDERSWTRQQILQTIAKKLLDKYELLTFQSLSQDAQQVRVTQLLKSTRHLLILDNLESIIGSPLAIRHTLSRKEQEALRLLLVDLVGGQALVMLGSRSEEEWLSKGTFEENRYDLAGLDQEAASQLAERVMERQGTTRYRTDLDLPKLLKLLDGFPLALEVVLANLTRQTPAEVIAALQAGGTDLQVGTSEKRTENILRCVDYSYRNLSAEAQQLLLCLAPFTTVIWRDMLSHYVEQLKLQPVLANLPFERWNEVIQETEKWGLLSADYDVPSLLHIQPVLPYFLRHRLASQASQGHRMAAEKGFYQHYLELGKSFYVLLVSKDAQQRQVGILLIRYEYENLLTALRWALSEKISIESLYSALDLYLEHRQDYRQSQQLDTLLLHGLERFSPEEMTEVSTVEWINILNSIAKNQTRFKQYEGAKDTHQKTLYMIESVPLEKRQRGLLQARTYHSLGIVAQEQRQWKQAENYYQQVLQINIEFEARLLQARTYHNLGVVAQAQRQWKQAENYYQQALQIKIEFKDRYGQAPTYHGLGIVAQEQRQWKQAENYYQQALQIKIEFKDRYEQARTYRQLGIVAQAQRQWEQAENYSQQALQIYIEFKDRYEQASAYHNLGLVAQEQRQWKQAENYYQQALQIKIEFKDRYGQANTYHNLGLAAWAQRQWKQAENYYQQALRIYTEFKDRYGQASTYLNLGVVAQEQRQWEQAENYYQQALQIYIEFKDRYEQARMYHNLGVVAQEQCQWEQAKDRLLEALRIFVSSHDTESAVIVLRSLARLWLEIKTSDLLEQVASILKMTTEELESLFQQVTVNSTNKSEEADA